MVSDLFKRAQGYVGTPYLLGEFDCADLAVRVQWELFDRLIALPDQRSRPSGSRGQAREIARLQAELAERIDAPVTGCGVLLFEPDGSAASAPMWHIGTVFVESAVVWVLHNSFAQRSAALQRLADLQRFGMRLEGFYAWRPAA